MSTLLSTRHPMHGRYQEGQAVTAVALLGQLDLAARIARGSGVREDDIIFMVDLDDTVYQTRRTAVIMQAFIRVMFSTEYPQFAHFLAEAERIFEDGRAGYFARDNWELVTGDEGKRYADRWFTFWRSRFFSPEAVQFDRVDRGVTVFLWRVKQFANVGYVTGRHQAEEGGEFPAGLEAATRTKLAQDNLPCDRLVCKPRFDMSDTCFKQDWFDGELIRNPQGLIGYADNEPAYVLAHHERALEAGLPHAVSLYVQTICSKPIDLPPGVRVLHSFDLDIRSNNRDA